MATLSISLHQGPHTQFGRDGQGLVQQRHGLLSVVWGVSLEEGVGVVCGGNRSIMVEGTCLGYLIADVLHLHRLQYWMTSP